MENYGKIKQAIKRKFPAIDVNDSLGTAIKLMAQGDVSVLAVMASEELIGIVTITDVMHGLANNYDLEETKISTFMTECKIDAQDSSSKSCIQLDEDENAIAAIKVMYEGGINHLLVSGENNEARGIVSTLDLIKLVASK